MARPKVTLVDPDVRLLQALAHPARLAILRELAGANEVCACDFTMCCDVRQPTVSHHLKILKEAGVIESERRGSWIFYKLVPAAGERLRALVGEVLGGPQLIRADSLLTGRRAATPGSAPARPV